MFTILTRCVCISVVLETIRDMNFIKFTHSVFFLLGLSRSSFTTTTNISSQSFASVLCVNFVCIFVSCVYISRHFHTHTHTFVSIRFDSFHGLWVSYSFRNSSWTQKYLFKQTKRKTNNFGSKTKPSARLLI